MPSERGHTMRLHRSVGFLATWLVFTQTVFAQCDLVRTSAHPGGGIGSLQRLDESTAVFASDGWVQAVDLSDPTTIAFGDAIEVSSRGLLATSDGTLYVTASGERKVVVLAVEPGGDFRVVGEVHVDADRLTVSDDLLLSAGNKDAPTIIDISDPHAPKVLTNEPASNYARVPRSGDLIWCLDGRPSNYTVRAWNIGDPTSPAIVSEFIMEDEAVVDLMLVEGLLYVNARDRVVVVDYTTPTAPVEIASVELPAWSHTFSRHGDFLYVPLGSDGICAVDVSDTRRPSFAGEVVLEGVVGGRVDAIEFVNQRVLAVLDSGRLIAMTSAEPLRMVVQDEARQPAGTSVYMRAVPDGLAVVAHSKRVLYLVSRADPDAPEIVWSAYFPSTIEHVVSVGHLLLVSTLQDGTQIFDVSSLSSPIKLSAIPHVYPIQWIDAKGGTVISMTADHVLAIHDISDPSSPRLKSELRDPALNFTRYAVMLEDGLAYIGGPSRELRLLNYTDPANPWLEEYLEYSFSLVTPFIVGNRMYGHGDLSLAIYDISDPRHRVRIGTVPVAGSSVFQYPFGIHNSVLFSVVTDLPATPQGGWVLHDIRDPADPREILLFPREFEFGSSVLQDSWVYQLSTRGVLVTYRISNCEVCVADYDDSGKLDFFDLTRFLNGYAAQAWRADVTQDGDWTVNDVLHFVSAFQTGCP